MESILRHRRPQLRHLQLLPPTGGWPALPLMLTGVPRSLRTLQGAGAYGITERRIASALWAWRDCKWNRYCGTGGLHFITCSCYRRQPWLGTSLVRDLFPKRIERLHYMHRNPVQRGLVDSPDPWRWSNFRSYVFGEVGLVRVNETGLMKIQARAPAVNCSSARTSRCTRTPDQTEGPP